MQTIRRHLHQNPEIGFEVEQTANLVVDELQKHQIPILARTANNGIIAELGVAGATQRIALRADMDALPMNEEGSCSYRSQIPGRAHLCGHDAHTAMLLGAAKVLAQNKKLLKASVRFIFQPNEENYPGGAPNLIAAGALENVDQIFGLHVWPQIPVGHFGVCRGPTMGRPDVFRIQISGKGGHASLPHETIDPIIAGAQMILAFQNIISRNVWAEEAAVLSVTQFHAGTTHNVIPSRAFIEGTVRTFSDVVGDQIITRMRDIVKGFEKAFEVEVHFEHEPGYPVLVNHESGVRRVEQSLAKLFPNRTVESFSMLRVLAGEDFAYYLKETPGCFWFLGCGNISKGITRSCHHPQFDLDEEALIYGAALHCQIALL
jgi:amidohydrolase